ncbi:hypothetical protein Scep_009842 [Stephania cephalantha]|uniref:Uncharacterized protein n=1 Tax=Stephania cephalantha TaxID=152367 RepID=A0AAP0JUC1_9MAGN
MSSDESSRAARTRIGGEALATDRRVEARKQTGSPQATVGSSERSGTARVVCVASATIGRWPWWSCARANVGERAPEWLAWQCERRVMRAHARRICNLVTPASSAMREMVCSLLGGHGGAHFVAEEPGSSRRSPLVAEEPGTSNVSLYSKICCEDVALTYIEGWKKLVCSLLGGHGGARLVAEEPGSSRRSPLVADEPGLSRRSPPTSKMGVWPWASMALGEYDLGRVWPWAGMALGLQS